MTATITTDPSGVEYQFTRYAANGTTQLFTSPWQDSPVYTDNTGLSPNTTYTYTVNFLDEDQLNVTGLVGVVGGPGETWNQGTMSASALIPTTGGAASTVSVSGLGNDGRTTPSAGLGVFNGGRGFFGKGQDTTIVDINTEVRPR